MGHTLSDNRHGLVANAVVTLADGYAEREAAKAMVNDARQAQADPTRTITLGADKGYDAREFIEACQAMNVIPMWRKTSQAEARLCPMRLRKAKATRYRSKRESSSSKVWLGKTVGG
ncbi:transposase [Acidovorax sp.]|uniref:transposase n=1 Tax=Acidovorax sp. TaxID=1872122 RepID=UPI002ACECF00|nr:transposase [Acidovorax sp.]MDZ7867289.1 transposase [Acidovorax sp.]